MTRVLFVCVRNRGKSPMAAALLLRALGEAADRWQVGSAGTGVTEPVSGDQARPNALSVEVLAEVGVDLSGHRPRRLTADLQQAADLVVTVGEAQVDRVPGPAYEAWEVDEPSLRGIDGTERMRLVRDDLDRRVRDLHRRLTDGGARRLRGAAG